MVLHISTLLITPEQPRGIPNIAAKTTCLKDKAWLQATVLIGSQHQQNASNFRKPEIRQQPTPQTLGLEIKNAARRALQCQTQRTILPKESALSLMIDLTGSLMVSKTGRHTHQAARSSLHRSSILVEIWGRRILIRKSFKSFGRIPRHISTQKESFACRTS